ncbi:MAG: hypothetical protein ACI9QL_004092 [Candidatus Omnitrophota bacterium]|jgi:hypothetical protein
MHMNIHDLTKPGHVPEGFGQHALNRRMFLGAAGKGLGGLALSSLLPSAAMGQSNFGQVAAKAKRIIFLCMAGGPSHLESFDYKPKLKELDGKPMPASFTQGQPIAQLQGQALKCKGPLRPFAKYGKSGQEISDYFPHIAGIADDICIVRSMVTEQINHDPAHTFINTGSGVPGRPSMGSWLNYGLGSETENLPAFVVLTSVGGGQAQPIAARQWHSGFLPGKFQGVKLQSKGDAVLYVSNPNGVGREQQGDIVRATHALNGMRSETIDDPEIATRISQYELAFKMQASVPELTDFGQEPQHVLDQYGCKPGDGSFASNCLLARRLAERGVRFIHLYHRGWDHHGNLEKDMAKASKYVDQASAALVSDLKQRGMLEDTLVVWGGEFGRTPMAQGSGRDHHIKGFSWWMAGGGIKPGITYGSTDELGYNAVDNVVHLHDFHATMLHLFGLDHKRLTFRFQGRQYRLTDVHGHIVQGILA